MSHFQVPVEHYMTPNVYAIAPDDDLSVAHERLRGLAVSSLPVVDGDGVQGVISMTDLLRVGRRDPRGDGRALLALPKAPVAEQMTRGVQSVDTQTTVAQAAATMVGARIHRIYVIDDGALRGVLSTKDLMLAIRDQKTNEPISKWMSSPAFTVRASEPIGLATERLERAHVSGLVVVDDGWPVGVFSQREAIESGDLPPETQVDDAMSSAMLVLDAGTPLHRAAAQAASLRVRRVIAVDRRDVKGILTGLDFARAAM